jgi:hypothetical protein
VSVSHGRRRRPERTASAKVLWWKYEPGDGYMLGASGWK